MTEEQNNEVKKSAKEILSRVEDGKEGRSDFFAETKEVKEKESSREDELVREEIKREIEIMNQDENLKKESESKAKKIQVLGEEEKIEHLFKIAKEKGVAYAVKIASNMNDPYILDIFHDVLVREGLWKRFEK